MKFRTMLLASLMMLVTLIVAIIASAIPSRSNKPAHGDLAATLTAATPVPAGVMSTLRRACFDCHSYETRWPWYSALPVASWLVEHDVEEARAQIAPYNHKPTSTNLVVLELGEPEQLIEIQMVAVVD